MMRIAVIADRHTVQAFSLAGVKDVYAAEDLTQTAPMESAFVRFTRDGNISVLFLTEKVSRTITEKLKYYSELKSLYPLVITIPDMSGDDSGDDRIKRLIRRAVGVDLQEE